MDPFGKTVIVTGASEGIGAATAIAFGKQGARVVLAARTEEKLWRVAEVIGEENTLVVPTDISRPEEVKEMVSRAVEYFDRIDILINNAGVGLAANVVELSPDDFRHVWSVNILGSLYTTQEVAEVMKRRSGGLIMNVSSMITRVGTPGSGGYRATKRALEALSDATRLELRRYNIRVVTVYPGLTATAFFSHGVGSRCTGEVTPGTRGKPPEFVARKIVEGARREPRSLYMGVKGRVTGIAAELFPSFLEWLMLQKTRRI